MSLIASKLCQFIRPASDTNPDAANYEYYLVWIGVDGGFYNQMFEDFTTKNQISGEIINTKSSNISKLFKNAYKSVKLVAEDLTENEFDYISKIIRAKEIRRYFKDNSYVKLAIITSSSEKRKSQFRYDFEIEVQEIEDKILN